MVIARGYLIAFLSLGAMVFAASSGQAAVLISVGSLSVTSGSTGNHVDVLVSNTDPQINPGSGVAKYLVNMFVVSGSGITFTSVPTTVTSSPYLFDGHSGAFTGSITALTASASDTYSPTGSAAGLDANTTYGLVRLTFDVAANAKAGNVALQFDGSTTLLNASGIPTIEFGTQDGVITIRNGLVATPAPATLVLGGLGMTLLGLRRKSRSSR